MYFGKSIDQVTFEDIQNLVDAGVMENRILDYKKDIPNNIGGDYRREFCKDIVAFANTEGGTLIYGIEEIGDSQPNIVGVEIPDIDTFLQQATNIIRTNIEPTLYDFKFNPIPIGEENKYVLCIDIPKSWAGPHAVKVGECTYRFYTRVNTSNVGLNIPGIQNSFLSNEDLTNRIRSFHKERNQQILAKENALPIEGPFLSLHLIPRQAFTSQTQIDLQRVAGSSTLLSPIFAGGYDFRYNLDGFMYYAGPEETNRTYNQIFRNGIMEIVTNRYISMHNYNTDYIPGYEVIKELISALPKYMEFYKNIGINAPIYGFLSFYNVKSHKIYTETAGLSPSEITHHYINLPEFIIATENMENLQSHLKDILQFPLDVLWNAGGIQSCSQLEEILETLLQQGQNATNY
ncbi:helix-turn-helix domain-containing protein [Bacillus cereus]|uniref:AlbA family DNA-binding domain-containing protein n=1 Tax=Bacillus cereus TaxID=1396 RepID=UPI001879F1B4|nr:RNA-binding domain-containing protein [Bacillus cereus]MBE7123960.1 ATP-binding protein [Bacillus cereus]